MSKDFRTVKITYRCFQSRPVLQRIQWIQWLQADPEIQADPAVRIVQRVQSRPDYRQTPCHQDHLSFRWTQSSQCLHLDQRDQANRSDQRNPCCLWCQKIRESQTDQAGLTVQLVPEVQLDQADQVDLAALSNKRKNMSISKLLYSLYLCLVVLWAMNWLELNWILAVGRPKCRLILRVFVLNFFLQAFLFFSILAF